MFKLKTTTLLKQNTPSPGGTSDYRQLQNKPTINDVELNGNLTSADLGLQPAGSYLTEETDPIFSQSASAGITSQDITNWNNKSEFSGNYNDLTNKPNIPTATSNLTNDSGFINKDVNNLTNYYKTTETYTKTEVDNKVSSVYKYKGTVSTYGDLPSTGLVVGDVYNIETADSTHGIDAGDNVAWNGTTWDVLAGTIDLSNYLAKDNTTQYTPVGEYNPATKGYIDAFKNRFFEGSDEEWDALTDEQKASYLLAIVTPTQIIFDTDLYYMKKYKFTLGSPLNNTQFEDANNSLMLSLSNDTGHQIVDFETYYSMITEQESPYATYCYFNEDTSPFISDNFSGLYDWSNATMDKWYRIVEENNQTVVTELNDNFSFIGCIETVSGVKNGESIDATIVSQSPLVKYWEIDGFQWYFKNIEEYHTKLHIGDEYRFVFNDVIDAGILLDTEDENNMLSIDLKDSNNQTIFGCFVNWGIVSTANDVYTYLRNENVAYIKGELGTDYDWDNAERDKWYHTYLESNVQVTEKLNNGPTMVGYIRNGAVEGTINGVEVVKDANDNYNIAGTEWAFASIKKIESQEVGNE